MSASIVYTLIARSTKTVLCDYTEFTGNFQQISLLILGRIKKDSKCEIEYNDYKYYYDDENDITFLCMCENFEAEVAFQYLSELKKIFREKYEERTIRTAYSYGLSEFQNSIKDLATSYEKNPKTKIDKLTNQVTQTAEVLHENIEKLLQRNEKLNIIAQKSKRLQDNSDLYIKTIHDIKKKQKMKKYRNYAMIAGFVFCILFLYHVLF
jgi:vesicle-associated membrane protein 7